MRKVKRSMMKYRVNDYLKRMRKEAKLHKESLPTMKELREIIKTIKVKFFENRYPKYAKPNLRNLHKFIGG